MDHYHEQKGLFDKLSQKVQAILTEALEEDKRVWSSMVRDSYYEVLQKKYHNLDEILEQYNIQVMNQ